MIIIKITHVMGLKKKVIVKIVRQQAFLLTMTIKMEIWVMVGIKITLKVENMVMKMAMKKKRKMI